MKVIRPTPVTEASLISSSLYEAAPAVYPTGAPFSPGAYTAMTGLLGEIKIYKNILADAGGHTPDVSPTYWAYSHSTYQEWNSGNSAVLGTRAQNSTTHLVYESIVADAYGNPLDSVATPAWSQIGERTYVEPTLAVVGTPYVVGDIRRDTVMAPDPMSPSSSIAIHEIYICNTADTPGSVYFRFNANWTRHISYPRPYVSGSAYNAGYVVIDATGMAYVSNINGNFAPFDNRPAWTVVGPTNKWASFDDESSSQAIAEGEIEFTVATGIIDAVAIINTDADIAYIAVRDGLGGAIVYENTLSLGSEVVTNAWEYYFTDPLIRRRQSLFTGIPPYAGSHVTIRLVSSGTVKLGNVIFGKFKDVGLTNFGVQAGVTDFSTVKTDDFGKTTFVKRGNAKHMQARDFIKTAYFNRAFNLLSDLTSVPCLYLASDQPEYIEGLMLLAYFKDFNIEVSGPKDSYCSLELRGIL